MELLELEITNVAHGGIFVARHEGRVIFVSDAIDGERVLARVSDTSQKNFWRADTVEVLKASEHRQNHVWSAASVERDPEERVGGAEFGHITLAHQRDLKAFVIEDSLQRFGGLDAGRVADVVGGSKLEVTSLPGDDASGGIEWRTRVRLHVDDDGRVGPYAARSHRVIPVDDLPLAVPELEVLAPLNQRISGATSIDLVAPSADRARVSARSEGTQDKLVVIHERVGNREFALAETGFWQVHRHAAATLSDAVSRLIDGDRFDVRAANHDLYGGVGLLAAAVGDRFGSTTRITSVESNEDATEFAAENLADWVGARALTARVDRYLRDAVRESSARDKEAWAAATVVLDPPRAGAGREVVDALGALSPEQIIYVACDPVALARDIKYFAAQGYALEALEAFDLFPNTHHVEAVARLGKSAFNK
jgi:tRNA/tmRNA/rRNA uracil-C5-methylase (TrmA/RlmC/RlmD family)